LYRNRALSFLVAVTLLLSGIAIVENSMDAAAAENLTAIPLPASWGAGFTPEGSAWDSAAEDCVVVGRDSAGQSSAWLYRSNAWQEVVPSSTDYAVLNVGSGPGNFSATIQPAVDAALPGDTVFVWPGTYNERVIVKKAITIKGHDRSSTILDVGGIPGDGFLVTADDVHISGFTIMNAPSSFGGINLNSVEHCTVTMCSFDSNVFSISVQNSISCNLSYNTFIDNSYGVYLYMSQFSSFYLNSVVGSTDTGILMQSSHSNVLEANSFSSNYDAIFLEESSDNNIIKNNTVLSNSNNGIYLTESSGNTVKGNSVQSNGYYGMAFSDSPNNIVTGNNLFNNNRGFYVMGASIGNQIYQNNFLFATTTNVYDSNTNMNNWHAGNPATGGKGGNYYHGHTIPDRGDGIGASTYSIPSGPGQDIYPWMEPSGWVPFFEKIVDKNALSIMVNNDTKNEQKTPSMAIGPDGSINIVWEDRRTTSYDIYFAKSTDGGKTFPFNTKVSDAPGITDELTPKIAIDSSGIIYVVWQDKRADANGDIFFSKSVDGGTSFSVNYQLTSTGTQGWPSVAVYGSNVYVVWHNNPGTGFDIYFMRSTNGGNSWSAQSKIDHSPSGDQTYPSMAIGNAGEIFIVWHDNRAGNYDIYFTKSTDDGVTFTTPDVRVNSVTTNDQLYPRLAANSDGIHVVWQDYATSVTSPTIEYTKSTNLGSSFIGSSIRVSTLGGTVNTAPDITLAPSGKIFVAWQRSNDILLSYSVNAGGTFLAERLFTRQSQSRQNPSIGVDQSGRLFGTWHITTFEIFCVEHTGAYLTIQAAINAARNEGTVRVKPATYFETVSVNKTSLKLIGEIRDTTIINAGGASYPVDIKNNSVSVSGLSIINPSVANGRAIRAISVGGIRISNVMIDSPVVGIEILSNLGNNVVENSVITAANGINFEGDLANNRILNNTIQWKTGSLYGNAIYFLTTAGNVVDNNSIEGFVSEGVYFESSGNNLFTNNDFVSNYYAIYIDGNNGNRFYHNNILGSTHSEPVYTSSGHFFDNGYPDGGNYWSDYVGVDNYRGAGQNIPGSDGMGETPYGNMEGNVCYDNYPWMQESGWLLDYPVKPKLNAVSWDAFDDRFWMCGNTGGDSTVYHVPSGSTSMVPLDGAPSFSFTAVAADHLGNILVGGNDLNALYYYSRTLNAWYEVTESGTGSMMGWNVTDISFNLNDHRFYIVGNVLNQNKAVAFFTDVAPLSIGAQCYLDTSSFMNSPGQPSLKAIEWNAAQNFGMAVGGGVYVVQPYDGNALDELYWSMVQSPESGKAYNDITWDAWGNSDTGIAGWDRACIVGSTLVGADKYGSFWQYDHSKSSFALRHTNPGPNTEYTAGSVRPPSSPPWLYVFGPAGGWMIEILDGGTRSDVPKVFSVQMYKSSDVTRSNLLNRQVDADSTYTFLVEYSFVVSGIDRWVDSSISVMAWYDEGKIGDFSSPESSWSTANNRTRQFCLNYSMSSKMQSAYYPQPLNGQSEYFIEGVWEDPTIYNGNEFRHRLMMNISFGPQTFASSGAMLGAVNTWDRNLALNDLNTWDLCVQVRDAADAGSFNSSYNEFGVKESASIYSVGNPGGSSPPGAVSYQLPSTCLVYYSVNTEYFVKISISDLHLNGNPIDPNLIPADHLMILNNHTLAPGNSDISSMTGFAEPGIPLYIWVGPGGSPIPAPTNGMQSAGPGYSDYSVGFIPANFEATELVWWVTVPVGLPEGVYRATITLTISD
jgi:parallel beta-helix repeat protein